jgi:hypothetical protein
MGAAARIFNEPIQELSPKHRMEGQLLDLAVIDYMFSITTTSVVAAVEVVEVGPVVPVPPIM